MKDLDYIYTSTLPNKNANSINVSHFSEALASKFNFRLFSYIESDVDEIYSHYNIKEKFHIEKLNGNKYLAVIYLLLRKKLAYFVLLLSLISVLFQMGYITFSINMAHIMTPFIVIAAVLLVLFSKHSKKKNWIN